MSGVYKVAPLNHVSSVFSNSDEQVLYLFFRKQDLHENLELLPKILTLCKLQEKQTH